MADLDAVVLMPGPSAGPSRSDLRHHLAAVRSQATAAHERARELRQRMERVLAETTVLVQAMVLTQETIRARQSHAARTELVQQSAYTQMAARLQTMPVIEQAKGIIMAQSRCAEAEAFQILRRVSQRSNVPVRDLAAQIVAKAIGQATIRGQLPARRSPIPGSRRSYACAFRSPGRAPRAKVGVGQPDRAVGLERT